MDNIARGIIFRLVGGGADFGVNIWRTRPGIPERGDPYPEWSVASEITGGKFTGPVADLLEDEIYISANKEALAELDDFAKTGSENLFIVSTRLKDAIESLGPRGSEFIPVRTSLRAPDREDPLTGGGGEVVDGAYWLWNCYNWIDLIDEERSVPAIELGTIDQVRGDLPGSPVQAVRLWGSAGPQRGRRLAFKPIDYAVNPFFRIVGLPDGLFVSPAAAEALDDAGLLTRYGGLRVVFTELDLLSPPQEERVPLRVAGTDILLDETSPPLAPRNAPEN